MLLTHLALFLGNSTAFCGEHLVWPPEYGECKVTKLIQANLSERIYNLSFFL